MIAEPVLQTIGAARQYGAVTALHPTDLVITPGERVGLLGPSGSGKSTLLRLLAGLRAVSSGQVLLDGATVGPDMAVARRRSLGFVIQEGGLFPHLTARRNVTLAADWLGWDQRRLKARVADLADMVQLDQTCLGRYPTELSGGQRQRVALMRALFLDPPLLLLDEPLGALDPLVRSELQDDLSALFNRLDKTVVLVTHDVAEARRLCDRLVLMSGGRLVADGSFDDLMAAGTDPIIRRFVASGAAR